MEWLEFQMKLAAARNFLFLMYLGVCGGFSSKTPLCFADAAMPNSCDLPQEKVGERKKEKYFTFSNEISERLLCEKKLPTAIPPERLNAGLKLDSEELLEWVIYIQSWKRLSLEPSDMPILDAIMKSEFAVEHPGQIQNLFYSLFLNDTQIYKQIITKYPAAATSAVLTGPICHNRYSSALLPEKVISGLKKLLLSEKKMGLSDSFWKSITPILPQLLETMRWEFNERSAYRDAENGAIQGTTYATIQGGLENRLVRLIVDSLPSDFGLNLGLVRSEEIRPFLIGEVEERLFGIPRPARTAVTLTLQKDGLVPVILGTARIPKSEAVEGTQIYVRRLPPISEERFYTSKSEEKKDLKFPIEYQHGGQTIRTELRVPFTSIESLERRAIEGIERYAKRRESLFISKYSGEKLQRRYQLTKSEVRAIEIYSADGYSVINPAFWSNDESFYEMKPAIFVLARALSKLPRYKADKPLLRGTYLPDDVAEQHQVGNVVTYPAFTSTSKVVDFPMDYKFQIVSKCGRDISQLAWRPREAEVLHLPFTKFKILRRKKLSYKSAFIVMEEVDCE